jgi:murein L,D-transpeptidase YcbB/YkuD
MRKFYSFFYYLILSATLISCSETTLNEAELDKANRIEISKSVFQQLEKDSLFPDFLSNQLNQVYSKVENYTIWVKENKLTEEAHEVITLFKTSHYYGLDSSLYLNAQLTQLLQKTNLSADDFALQDICISKSFLLLAHHHHKGILPSSYQEINYNPTFNDSIIPNYTLLFDGVIIENFWKLVGMKAHHPEYNQLQMGLENYCKSHLLSKEKVEVPLSKSDSIQSYIQAKKALIIHQYLSDADGDAKVMEALMKFQEDHNLTPDGKIGKYTSRALERSPYEIWLQAAVNLQKWRWEKNWPTTVLFANIPSYDLKIYENNQLQQTHKTVTGAPLTATPTLDSQLEYFIINPEWYVPFSITSGELVPKMKKDSTYLERNGYSIVSKEGVTIKDIDWNTVSATNFKYSIKQGKGGQNALGRVKFIFNNKHSVYFHDTPSKSFFNKDVRAFSHGCVRVQNPFDLVDYILKREKIEISKDSVQSIVKIGNKKTIKPKQVYPIRIRYYTSTGDSIGNLKTHFDIYDEDVEIMKVMEQYLNNGKK